MLKTNPKGKYDLKLYYYQYSTEKRDVVVNINPEGKHDEDVNVGNMNNAVRKRLYKKTEKKDRKDDITNAV